MYITTCFHVILTTCSFLICWILTVFFAITQWWTLNASWDSLWSSMGTQKLVSWTSNSCTVLFIGAILAVSVTITVETGRNAEGILTAKLTNMARWKIWNCNKTCILIETTNEAISTTFWCRIHLWFRYVGGVCKESRWRHRVPRSATVTPARAPS